MCASSVTRYFFCHRVKISAEKANVVSRLSAFEARAAKRTTIGQLLYLPLFFALYGLLLGK